MDFSSIDLANATLTLLFAVGAVNVITLFVPNLSSQTKYLISLVAAFVAFFIPADVGNLILNALKDAIVAATAASGVYKIAQKSGGH